ncbi:MAG: hypothetical protein Q8L23_06930 [Caulobacter sp.]|nr:hypothetical protein [Caulobacter sp.]
MANQPVELVEKVAGVGGVGLVTLEGGSGRPLLMLHDELGLEDHRSLNRRAGLS